MAIPLLPAELFRHIVWEVPKEDTPTLASLSLVSTSFRAIAHPRLYRHVTFTLLHPNLGISNCRLSDSSILLHEAVSQPESELLQAIEAVEVVGEVDRYRRDGTVDAIDFVRELFKLFGFQVHYHFTHPPRIGEFDIALADKQVEKRWGLFRGTTPNATLVADASEFLFLHLLGSYICFRCTSDDLGDDPDFLQKLLASSATKLDSLEIPLDRFVVLDHLADLAKLKVRFVPERFVEDMVDDETDTEGLAVAENFVSILPNLSLTRLILAGQPVHEELRYLFNPANPSFTLPDSVASLSLETYLAPSFVLHFLENLSPESDLQELNVWLMRGIEEEEHESDELVQQLQDVCKKRRIVLKYSQEWDL